MFPTKLTPYLRTSSGVPALCTYSTADCRVFHARSIGFRALDDTPPSLLVKTLDRFPLSIEMITLVVTMNSANTTTIDPSKTTLIALHYFQIRIFVKRLVGWLFYHNGAWCSGRPKQWNWWAERSCCWWWIPAGCWQ